ncbi:MAG TPA: pyruvate kinase [Burkholderiales bacterium]|nr:pyruvate kinase [Burkholderiales bacterium]
MSQARTDHEAARRATEVEAALRELGAIREDLAANGVGLLRRLEEVHPSHRDSARNLLHYLALRRHDLRALQDRLAALGLSSLGRAEAHVAATVDAVLDVLHLLAGRAREPRKEPPAVEFDDGQRLLTEHTEALLGPAVPNRAVRIMVTMPSEAGDDSVLMDDLLRAGMDCMRINCAHDNPDIWRRMIANLRRAEQSLGRTCRVVMDLGGPKLRTGPIEPGPMVARVKPRRDLLGRVTSPARVWLTSETAPQAAPAPADGCLSLPSAWLARLRDGERVRCRDARGAKRELMIVEVSDGGCWVETMKSTYFVPGTKLERMAEVSGVANDSAVVGALPPLENAIPLERGDLVIVTRDLEPGRLATRDAAGRPLAPASIGCTIPEVFDDVQAGDAIWFDDGRIGGVVERVEPARVTVRVTRARLRGEKLRAGKGINLPDSEISLPALTPKDRIDLGFVAEHADVVELSFANRARDVEALQAELAGLGARKPGIVLKIETRRGFENLPDMLITAMRWPACGVMIARGDLAVECGFERLAEVQEETLWLCEAAHVPVIWATQVLETLAKEGMPSRAEITDAAMGHRAECVMLNKGPHVVNAVRVLDDILRRMQAHQTKKRAMLRELRLAHRLPPEAATRD